ncbi:MAG TPA: hypothetical protein VGP51_00360, partial [Nocardioidaceae bacterium]|nr:hypothetical protein [Nocardioidaceae bacterium]
MPTDVEIRRRTDPDLDACVMVLQSAPVASGYPVNWPADPVRWLSPQEDTNAWVATADARAVGHLVQRGPDGRTHRTSGPTSRGCAEPTLADGVPVR